MPVNFSFYFGTAILALLSWWLVELTETGEIVAGQTQSVGHSPEYFSNGYVKWEMDEAGVLKSKLTAKVMTHYNGGDTHLDKTVLTLMNRTTPPWVIQADTGIISADGKHVLLQGKAVVERAGAPGVSPLKINSTNVRVQPERNYAETDEWAELLSPPNRTEGVGMQLIYNDPIQIKLFSKVRGKYEIK